VKKEAVDIAFLDIEMPSVCGLELAEKLIAENQSLEVIFVTAYDKYALKAFQVHAIGYVLKPLDSEEVKGQIDNVLRKLKRRQNKAKSRTLTVKCFGRFTCCPSGDEGDILRWRTSKAEELLALLIHYRGKPMSREIIIDILWPEADPENAANNFRVTCTYLRNTFAELGFKDVLLRNRDNYMLNLDNFCCDSLDFIRIVNQDCINERNYSACEEASALCTGAYLENKPYEWALESRAWFENEFEKLQNRLADIYIKDGSLQMACQAIAKVLERNPLAEEAVHRLFALKLQMGDTVSGIKAYNEYKERLQKEMGIPPSDALQKLVDRAVCTS
jgi:two-component SAPR family response regulator